MSVSDKVASNTADVETIVMDTQKDFQCDISEADSCFSTFDIVLHSLAAVAALDSHDCVVSSIFDAVINDMMTFLFYSCSHPKVSTSSSC